jgi:hypothetical protein
MQLDKLTLKSQEALQEAQRIAQSYSHLRLERGEGRGGHGDNTSLTLG